MQHALVGPEFGQALKIIRARSSYVTNIIHALESICLPMLQKKQHYLEIDPVEGLITQTISKHFEKTSVIEAHTDFVQQFSNKYHVYQQTLCQIQEPISADLILCAHTLYHLASAEWLPTVRRIYDFLAPGGQAMFVLIAPRGYKHDLYETLAPDYFHAEQFYEILNQLNIPYTHQPNKIVFTTQTQEEMHELCRFMIYKNVLRGEVKNQYTAAEIIEIEKMITRFSRARETARKNFQLVQEEDWIFLSKP